MPLVEEVFESIGTSVMVTTLDLASGYWQIPMDPKSRDNAAFTTPFGLFEFEVLPFGLHSASAKFQRIITHVIRDCQQFSCAYLDDASVFSKNWEEHCAHLRQVFSRLHIAGLTLKTCNEDRHQGLPGSCCLLSTIHSWYCDNCSTLDPKESTQLGEVGQQPGSGFPTA